MKFYSDVKYFENEVLGGGIHVCTTEFRVMFNLNDIFELLQLEKPKRNRWKDQIDFDNVNFERNGRKVYEAFVNQQNAAFILNLYGKEIKDQLMRKAEIEYQIKNILKEYGNENIYEGFGDGEDLAYEFAIESLKMLSKMNDNAFDDLIYTVEMYPYRKYNHQRTLMQFDLEPEKEDHVPTYEEIVEQVRKELGK